MLRNSTTQLSFFLFFNRALRTPFTVESCMLALSSISSLQEFTTEVLLVPYYRAPSAFAVYCQWLVWKFYGWGKQYERLYTNRLIRAGFLYWVHR